MSGAETIKRATDSYVAGLITLDVMEKWIALGIEAERDGRRPTGYPELDLPSEYAIEEAMKETKLDA